MSLDFETQLNDNEFNKFRKLIYSVAGISLSERKRELVRSRLARRLRVLNLDSYADYYAFLCDPQCSAAEMEHFTNCLTTNKTEFYREPHHFEYLRETYLPALRQATLSGREKKVRIWCAASSTGQEPYTLAMTLMDYFGMNSDWDLRILASDIDTQVLATAAAGVYPESDVDVIAESARKKYLIREQGKSDTCYRVRDELKKLITFRQINLNVDKWPINIEFDAIFCRNVMIYFDRPTQAKLIEHFTEHLIPQGLLVIGHSESLFSISEDYDSLGETIYRMKPSVKRPGAGQTPPPITPAAANSLHVNNSTPDKADDSKPRVNNVLSSNLPALKPQLPAAVSSNKPRLKPNEKASLQLGANGSVDSPKSAASASASLNFDVYRNLPSRALIVGEYEASDSDCVLRTTLGSCIAACIFDAVHGIGGMNHFMLPESQMDRRVSASYGIHAMELLINSIMKLGGSRRHLQAKIFGGAHVVDQIAAQWDVGSRNIEFVKKFLDIERIPIVAQHVGGQLARQLRFMPTNGKVFLQLMDEQSSIQVDHRQRQVGSRVALETLRRREEAVTLF